jgi:hypothetical protein
MKNTAAVKPIMGFEDLLDEKKRLESLIENQKNIIRHDLEELKNEFKKEIRPAIEAATFIKKVAKPETRNQTIMSVGANLAVDFIIGRILGKSNFIVKLFLPKLIKNYSSHIFYKLKSKKKSTPTRYLNSNGISHSL